MPPPDAGPVMRLEVDLEADDEDEDHDAELSQDRQRWASRHREQLRGECPAAGAERARTEQDSPDDLPDHRRLAEPPEEGIHEPRHDDDDGDVDAYVAGKVDLDGGHEARQRHRIWPPR